MKRIIQIISSIAIVMAIGCNRESSSTRESDAAAHNSKTTVARRHCSLTDEQKAARAEWERALKKQEKQWWVSAEVSYDIPIYIARRHRAYISVGVYADYSFASETDSQSDRISLLMLSDTRDGFPLHRIMTTVVSGNRQGQKLVESRNLYNVGIKVAYRFAPYNPLKRNMKDCRCLIFD